MTPAIKALEQLGIPYETHTYENVVSNGYALEAADALGLDAGQVFKTLVVENQGDLAVAILPASTNLDLKACASLLKWKKCQMAPQSLAERKTGYLKGGISPFGQKTRLATLLDACAEQFQIIYVSGGRRGLDVGVAPGDLVRACDARIGTIGKPSG